MRGLFFTSAISDQSAWPLYICERVRPWMARALMPTSCKRSATSTIFLLCSSQPSRVFTVTGSWVPFTTARVREIIRSISFKTPAPAPLVTTFFTGQPKLMSSKSGFTVSTMAALRAIASSSPPKIWMPTGRSSSKISSFCRLFRALRISPSLLMNSVYIRSAPLCLQTARNGGSLTSSIGASSSGKSGSCILSMVTMGLEIV